VEAAGHAYFCVISGIDIVAACGEIEDRSEGGLSSRNSAPVDLACRYRRGWLIRRAPKGTACRAPTEACLRFVGQLAL